MSGKFISYEAAGREIDPDEPPQQKIHETLAGLPESGQAVRQA